MGDSLVALLLASPDDERRFALLAEFVAADPPPAFAEGERLLTSAAAAERELAAQTLGQVACVEPAMLVDREYKRPTVGALIERVRGELDA